MLRPIFWIALFYGFTRSVCADNLQHVIMYGLIFALSGALLAFADDVISD